MIFNKLLARCSLFSFLILFFCNSAFADIALFSHIQRWKTNQGVPVIFYQSPSLPMLNINVIFDAGSRRDGSFPGIANFTSAMLDEGTKTLTAKQIADGFADVGADFSANTNSEMTVISLQTLTKQNFLTPALKLYTEVLTQASFPQSAFKRNQKIILNQIQQNEQSPTQVLADRFNELIYLDTPYASPTLGTTASIQNMQIQNLQKFYQQYYVTKNAMITMVGDITEKQAKQITNQITANMPIGTAAKTETYPQKEPKNLTVHIPFPVSQTAIQMGERIAITRNNPTYVDLALANYILGGDTTSHLFRVVRDQYGLSYYVASMYIPMQTESLWTIALQTKNQQATKAISITKNVIANLLKQGITEQELKNAKIAIQQGVILNLSSNQGILSYLTTIAFFKLPNDYLEKLLNQLQQQNIQQVNLAMRQNFKLEKLAVVSVG